ncbi:ribosomal-processing cysteine protease Prp [Spirochaetia bacterium 38H-sp]|uniref:Ribosomal processing cysteine protease Prp n=1 Tax=Rarispira pelagica TaxID=3141764 RepID=A0ABU9UE42_9SPIR
MIFVRLYLQDGLIKRIESAGHASASEGVSIPCAGVSLVLRTAGRLINKVPAAKLDVRANKEGEFFLDVLSPERLSRDWYSGVSSYILQALEDLVRDFPDQIKLSVEEL